MLSFLSIFAALVVVTSTLPAAAQGVGPICQWVPTDGDGEYYVIWYGWHCWCQSSV